MSESARVVSRLSVQTAVPSDGTQLRISFNWAAILGAGAFYSYAVYAGPLRIRAGIPIAGGAPGAVQNLALTFGVHALTLGIFLFFVWLASSTRWRALFEARWTVGTVDLRNTGLYLIVVLGAGWPELGLPLVSDEIAHAQEAFQHSYVALIKLAPRAPDTFGALPAWIVLWAINLMVLAGAWRAWRWIRNQSRTVACITLGTGFVAIKLAGLLAGGGGMVHPPLRLLPIWLAGTVFSPSDISFRLATMISFAIALTVVARIMRRIVGDGLSFAMGIALGTTPCLLGVAVLVEPSFWTAIVWVIIALLIVAEEPERLTTPEFLAPIASIIALATMMRQSAFIVLIPLGLLVGWRLCFERKATPWLALFVAASPILLFLPFLAKSILLGTPASYIKGDFGVIGRDLGTVDRVIEAFRLGVVQSSAINALYPWGILLLFVAVVPTSRRTIVQGLLFVIWLAAACIIFFSIRPALWGNARYQAEFLSLFVAVGLLRGILWLREIAPVRGAAIGAFLLVTQCLLNLWTYRTIPAQNAPVDERLSSNSPLWKVRGQSELNFDHRSAYHALLHEKLTDRAFIVGNMYGVFSGVLYGDTLPRLARQYDVYLAYVNIPLRELPAALASDHRVDIVMVADRGGRALAGQFHDAGWVSWKSFVDTRNGSTIFAFQSKLAAAARSK